MSVGFAGDRVRRRAVWALAVVGAAGATVGCGGPVDGTWAASEGKADDTAQSGDPGGDTAQAEVPEADALPAVVPLYGPETALERALVVDRGDAIVTDVGDRGRDRHAREDEFQSYDHWLPHYWEHRTARLRFVDRVAKGGDSIDISMVSEWRLSVAEFRAWYLGLGTVAHYSGNYAPGFEETGPGTFDEDHALVSDAGSQYRYTFTLDHAIGLDGAVSALAEGQYMELEASQFLLGPPVGRANYYGTTMLYAVGVGGLVPWDVAGDFSDPSSAREDSRPIDAAARLGGDTTLHAMQSDEPDNSFMQMATNLAGRSAQPFVRGRRVHHTDMVDGSHDESDENPLFSELQGLAGPHYSAASCDSCHHRNGRARVPATGEALRHFVVLVGDADGAPLPELGRILQPLTSGSAPEGEVWIESWSEADGLRRPVYAWSLDAPPRSSVRIAPPLVGMGLLEAVPEAAVLALEDRDDLDGDGISGSARRVLDPGTGEVRLGRFGWKAGTVSVAHQLAAALAGDMGVTTSIVPALDCGAAQTDCGETGTELSDAHLDDLRRYVSLLGVRPQRDHESPEVVAGGQRFAELGCDACHLPTLVTSEHHPLAELRSQTIHPYTDLLLHDMGDGLADTLDEDDATGAEWRTPPLWGVGLGACVTGGVEGPFQDQVCAPDESYLHDGRARTLTEAVLWHGGEGAASRDAFVALDASQQQELLAFLSSL